MELIEKVKSKKAHIGIIGLGYVGLPLVIEFCKAGFRVTGFDIDPPNCRSGNRCALCRESAKCHR